MIPETVELIQKMKGKNLKSNKQCTNCIYYVSAYKDDYTLRHFGYGEVKIRPACSFAGTMGFVSHNPAASCRYYETKEEGGRMKTEIETENEKLKKEIEKLQEDNYFLKIDLEQFKKLYFEEVEDNLKLKETIVKLKAKILKNNNPEFVVEYQTRGDAVLVSQLKKSNERTE